MGLDCTTNTWLHIKQPACCAPATAPTIRQFDNASTQSASSTSDCPQKQQRANTTNQTSNQAKNSRRTNPVQIFSCKYPSTPLLELVDQLVSDPSTLGRSLSTVRNASGLEIPKVLDRPICFCILTSAGSPGHMSAKYAGRVQCNRIHIDIHAEPGKWSKDKLKPLFNYA
jgi:hypothetical protein